MTENSTTETTSELKDDWLIRQCPVYDDEYKDCTSIKARLNQLFIFGETLDCKQWKRDSINCHKWMEGDLKAGAELIESEKKRRKERLAAHYNNNVWTKRKSPPENWASPLPEHIQKEYEGTYLNLKSKEMKGEIPPTFDPNVRCTIL